MSVGLIRLAVAIRSLARLRRTSEDPGGVALGVFASCLSEIGTNRMIVLRIHREVLSPIAVGGWRPMVLVPGDWPELPESAQRACLLHELDHLARRDDRGKLLGELVRSAFFFHPGVAWLLARIDREAELLSDEAAVRRGIDPRDFARTLLEFARKPGRLRTPALPLFSRGSIGDRIRRLLEDDMPRTLAPASPGRILGPSLILIALAVPIGGLRVRAVEPGDPPRVEDVNRQDAENAKEEKRKAVVVGRVDDSDGHPIEGADVLVVVDGKEVRKISGRTDGNGDFRVEAPEGLSQYAVFVHKAGYAVSTRTNFVGRERSNAFRLARPSPFVARFVNREGNPLVGATVRVEITSYSTTSGDHTMTSFAYYRPRHLEGTAFAGLLEAKTDTSGLAKVPNLQEGVAARLEIVAADGCG